MAHNPSMPYFGTRTWLNAMLVLTSVVQCVVDKGHGILVDVEKQLTTKSRCLEDIRNV